MENCEQNNESYKTNFDINNVLQEELNSKELEENILLGQTLGTTYNTINNVRLEITIKDINTNHYKILFGYLKETNIDGTFIMYSDGRLKYTQSDGNGIITNDINIKFDRCDFIFDNPDGEKFIYLPVNIESFRDQLCQIPRSQAFKIIKDKRSKFLFFSLVKESQNDSLGKMALKNLSINTYIFDKYNNEEEEEPTCRITPKDLNKKINNIKSSKNRRFVTIKGFYRGLALEYSTEDNSNENYIYIGDVFWRPENLPENEYDSDELIKLKINIASLRTLSKLSGLTSDRTKEIKIYIEKNKPIKLVADIANQGTLSIYIKELK